MYERPYRPGPANGYDRCSNETGCQNFYEICQQEFKDLGRKAGLGTDISTYWARHSFANTMLNNGASIEMISESVGHSNSKTTENYLSGFKVAKKKEFANKLMDFLNE